MSDPSHTGEAVKIQAFARGMFARKKAKALKAADAKKDAKPETAPSAATAAAASTATGATTATASSSGSVGGSAGMATSPFVPTDEAAIAAFIELAQVTSGDVVADVGCGDARVLIRTAQITGASTVGIEYDAKLVTRAKEAIEKACTATATASATAATAAAAPKAVTQKQFEIIHSPLQAEAVISGVLARSSVVFLFMLPAVMEFITPALARYLPAGARVVSYTFQLNAWTPTAVRPMRASGVTSLYLYTITNELKAKYATATAATVTTTAVVDSPAA